MLFTDESRFCVDHADGRVRVWRRRGERYSEACTRQQDRWGGPHVMVWGWICPGGRTRLVFLEFGRPETGPTAQGYIDQVLRPVVLPFLQERDGFSLQQDNARAHSARVTQQFLQDNGVDVLEWPALSPDLSPIEHVWDDLGRRLNARQPPPTNVAQLREALTAEWDNISAAYIRNLVRSMRARCDECIRANGGHTHY